MVCVNGLPYLGRAFYIEFSGFMQKANNYQIKYKLAKNGHFICDRV